MFFSMMMWLPQTPMKKTIFPTITVTSMKKKTNHGKNHVFSINFVDIWLRKRYVQEAEFIPHRLRSPMREHDHRDKSPAVLMDIFFPDVIIAITVQILNLRLC